MKKRRTVLYFAETATSNQANEKERRQQRLECRQSLVLFGHRILSGDRASGLIYTPIDIAMQASLVWRNNVVRSLLCSIVVSAHKKKIIYRGYTQML